MKPKEYLAVPTKNDPENVTFIKCMRITVFLGQVFGLNPFLGVWENDASKMRFTYNSARFLYSVITVLLQGIVVFFFLVKVMRDSSDFSSNSSGINFFLSNWVVSVLFLRLAKNWPQLCRQISKIEAIDPIYDKTLLRDCNITCIAILVTGFMEHGINNVLELSRTMACEPDDNPFLANIRVRFAWLWMYIPFNTFTAIILKIINIQYIFNWTYSGIFIMCISRYLTARIQKINDSISSVRGQTVSPTFWRTIREDYTQATCLVRQVDQVINSITFVSFSSNLYSVCTLILHSLEDGLKVQEICGVLPEERLLKGYEYASYYIFSILFLLFRSLAVSLLAARINFASTQTALALYDIPSEEFNIEVQRLIDQIHGHSVALTGLRLFSIKRSIVLTIAAAIVTYELVLIQFNSSKK